MVPNLSPCGFWTIQQTSGARRAPGTVLGAGDRGANRQTNNAHGWLYLLGSEKTHQGSLLHGSPTDTWTLNSGSSKSSLQANTPSLPVWYRHRSFRRRDQLSLAALYFCLIPNWFLVDWFFFKIFFCYCYKGNMHLETFWKTQLSIK